MQRRPANGIDDQVGQRVVVEWCCNHERHIVKREALAVVTDDALVAADCSQTRYDAIVVVSSAVANSDENQIVGVGHDCQIEIDIAKLMQKILFSSPSHYVQSTLKTLLTPHSFEAEIFGS